MPQTGLPYAAIITKSLFSLAVIVLSWVVYRVARDVIKARIKDQTNMHTLRMLTRNALFLLAGVAILIIWLGEGGSFAVAMGILGAGIAFASQEVIGSFTGYLNIISGSIYRVGDRVRIGNVVGDVMDISILRTTIMEIGEWVQADQYTGRIVTVANRAVFSDPVFNYTQHWVYLWDEITIPVTYASDWRRAGEIMLEHAQEYTAELQGDAEIRLTKMGERFPLQQTQVEPTFYLTMTDNWIELSLRYVVDARDRRKVKAMLHRELLQHFESEPGITVASATFEIVGFPPLRHDAQGDR